MTSEIYALLSPVGEICYIGKTACGSAKRFVQHIWHARHGENNRKAAWIRSLLSRGERPSLIVLRVCEGDGCKEEQEEIAKAKTRGIVLKNHTLGGEGQVGREMSEETREKIANCQRGRHRTEEEKRAISQFHKENWKSPEFREMMIAMRTGKKRGPEFSLKMSLLKKGTKGKPRTPEQREAARLRWLGRKHSPESKLRMIEAWKIRKEKKRNQTPQLFAMAG